MTAWLPGSPLMNSSSPKTYAAMISSTLLARAMRLSIAAMRISQS
jgi:hypothetical protein